METAILPTPTPTRPPPIVDDTNIKKVKLTNNVGFGMGYYSENQNKNNSDLFDEDGSLKAKLPKTRGGLRETRQALQSYQKKNKQSKSNSNLNGLTGEQSVQKKTRKHRIVKPIGKPIASSSLPPTSTTSTQQDEIKSSPEKGMKLKIQVGGNSGIRSLDGKDFSSRIASSSKIKTNKKKRVRFHLENETMSISPIRDIKRKMRLQMVRGGRNRKTHSNRGTQSYLNHSRRTMKLKIVPLSGNSGNSTETSTINQTGSSQETLSSSPENTSNENVEGLQSELLETSQTIPVGLSLSDTTPESLRNDLLQLSGGIRNIRRVP
jgi:hypothetical protein